MTTPVQTIVMTAARSARYILRWVAALFTVAHRYSWRTKVAFFNAPAAGSFVEFRRVYGNYHRAIVHLLVGDIEAALQDPPPPYPNRWRL